MASGNKFRIDILDSGGNRKGSGALRTVRSVQFTKRLDRVGEASFAFPASDPKAALITPGTEFDIFDDIIGYIGRYIFRTAWVQDNLGKPFMNVSCWDALHELKLWVTGLGRDFVSTEAGDIVSEIVSDVDGWAASVEPNIGDSNVTYQGHSVLEAIDVLARTWGVHFRLGDAGKEIEFGKFGENGDALRLIKVRGQDNNTAIETALITQITQTVDDDELYNRIIGLGGGEGSGQLTLENATGGLYTPASRTPSGSQPIWYIQDDESVALFGVREQVVSFDDLHPIANTDTAKQQAADELYINAATHLIWHKEPTIEYSVSVSGLRQIVKAGDKLRIVYRGITDDYKYIDVDDYFWIIDASQNRSVEGSYTGTFTLSNRDKRTLDDAELIANTVKAVKVQKLAIKPTAFRFENTYYDSAQFFYGLNAGKDAEFIISIDDTMLDITRCIIRFKTYPLWTGYEAFSWGPANVTAGTVPNQATIQQWALVLGDLFPKNFSLELNGINIDNHVDVDYLSGGTGPWNSGGANSAVTVEMDITDRIFAESTIYKDHTLVFSLGTTGSENIAFPGSFTSPITIPGGGSHGFFETTIKLYGTAQALYRT